MFTIASLSMRRLLLPLLLPLMMLAACSTQVELRTAAQQEQFGRAAASRGDWAQAMRDYAAAAQNVELGHGDLAWQARLHRQAGRAASAACRVDAAEFHFRSASALAKQSGQAGLLPDSVSLPVGSKACGVPR